VGTQALFENPRLSPDGRRVAVADASDGDIWVFDFERTTRTRLTFDAGVDSDPVWSPDGTEIAFVSNRGPKIFDIYRKKANGSSEEQLLLRTAYNKHLDDWSRDGKFILYEEDRPETGSDLWALPLTGELNPTPLLKTRFNERQGAFSPDSRFIAYASDEGARYDVFVRAFAEGSGKWQASTAASTHPVWSRDGRELYFDSTGVLNAVAVSSDASGGLQFGRPRSILSGLQNLPGPHNFDAAPDGSRFLLSTLPSLPTIEAPISVIVDWRALLLRKD
jgi:serine/threonine-protein kinase